MATAKFKNSPEAFAHARHRSRYAHQDSVVWRSGDNWFVERYSRPAIKAAMLACGTRRHFFVISGKTPFHVKWREAVLRLRNARHLCAEVA